ncbi:WRKY transcription factor [Quillaja saponaria]|uniref:WRKY transcription factor n=1 Tax=Quillaja saponaria TaxID=32244 RepID=A0AAD7LJG4_QUISA|nr:WRKY transcription factor [Quillaja saponaria]
MENMRDWEKKTLLDELTQGRELARQLEIYLNVPSSSVEAREFLVQKIKSAFEKALAMCGISVPVGEPEPSHPTGHPIPFSESPPSVSRSPRREESDREGTSRKRETLPRWLKRIQVSSAMGLGDIPPEDGYSWRKYGQKEILGSKYPRGYYRCIHKYIQGCRALKQVQRSNEDPTVLEIVYRGIHTCGHGSSVFLPSGSQEIQEPHRNTVSQQQQLQQQQSEEVLLNFWEGRGVPSENLDFPQHSLVPSLQFPSTSNIGADLNQVSSASLIDNYCSMSPSRMNIFGVNQNLPSSESQISEIISADATSTANSRTVGLEFPFEPDEFDPNFTFDHPGS